MPRDPIKPIEKAQTDFWQVKSLNLTVSYETKVKFQIRLIINSFFFHAVNEGRN